MAVPQSSIIALSLMYTNLPPSATDLEYWSSPEAAGITWEEAVQAFATSNQAKAIYPFLAAPTVANAEQYVTQIFANAYGIAAEDIPAEELAYWVNWISLEPDNYLQLPVVINQYSPPERQAALQNRADVALTFAQDMLAAGNASFTPIQYANGWGIINTVTADPATVTAAIEAIDIYIGGGGGTTNTYTLLQPGAFIDENDSFNVSPANAKMTPVSENIVAGTNLGGNPLTGTVGSTIIDPSSDDNDILTATIVAGVPNQPTIVNIETINLTGAGPGSVIDINGISGVKDLNIISGPLTVVSSETHPITLAEGYASNFQFQQANPNATTTLVLNGTKAGASITDLNSAAPTNIIVKADSVLQNADPTLATIDDFSPGPVPPSKFVVTGEGNLTVNGLVLTDTPTSMLFDASGLTGKLTMDLGFQALGNDIEQLVAGTNDDTIRLTDVDDQVNTFITLNGNTGNDTLIIKSNLSNLAAVTNFETIKLEQAGGDTTLIPVDSVVAAGQTVTVDASAFTTRSLFFGGFAETNGSYKVIGGAGNDIIAGGDKDDILIGGLGADILAGNGGSNTFVYTSVADSNAGDLFAPFPTTYDVIIDFNPADDKLDLTGAGFTSTQFLGDRGPILAATLFAAANQVVSGGFGIGKNALASFTWLGDTYVIGTDNDLANNANDLFIRLDGIQALSSLNFA